MSLRQGLVKSLDFCNVLDDATHRLSPVKINLWAANLGVFGTFLTTLFAWTGNHIAGMEALWGGAMTWLTQAHATHHYDKKERNVSEARIIRAGAVDVDPK